MSSDSENDMNTPPGIVNAGAVATNNLLPEKSRAKYEKAYKDFLDWCMNKRTKSMSENELLAYFEDLSRKLSSASLWTIYSMVKSTLNIKHQVDISKYCKLITFLKRKSEGYIPKKAKTFSPEHITKFINEAPDQLYLQSKMNKAGPPLLDPSAGPSSTLRRRDQDSVDSNLSTPDEVPAQDPLQKGNLDQCRFCGEFNKDCVNLAADSKPYLETNKTSLTINGLSIELDFSDDTLPKTVCCYCDDKLQEMTDFVKKAIAAQNSLINVSVEKDVDTSLVKVEPETTEDRDDEVNADPLEFSEVFTHKRTSDKPEDKKKPVKAKSDDKKKRGKAVKRKSNATSENTVVVPKKKIFKIDIPLKGKSKVKQDQHDNPNIDNDQEIETHTQGKHDVSNVTEDTGLTMDIKEEIMEAEEETSENILIDIKEEDIEEPHLEHDTAIVYKPDETELASNALLFEMSKS